MTALVILGAVGAIILTWVVLLITRRPIVGVAIGLSAWAIDFTAKGNHEVDSPSSVGVEFGGTSVTIIDAASVLLLGAVLFTLLSPTAGGQAKLRARSVPKGFSLGLLGIVVLWAVRLARGADEFGFQSAVNFSRQWFFFIAFAAFGAWFGRQLTRRQLEAVWFVVAGALTFLAALFVVRNGFGGPGPGVGRALNGGQAVIVANAMLLAILRPRPRPSHLAVAAVFGTATLISQQRTVWATTIFALGVAAVVLLGRSGRLTRKWARLVIGSGTCAISVALLTLPDLARDINSSSNVSVSEGTAGWRVESALATLRLFASRPLEQMIFGAPAGTSIDRQLQSTGEIISVTPHNTYLYALLTLGVVGLLLQLTMFGSAILRARTSPVVAYLFPIVLSQLVYSIGYEISPDQALLLGVFAAGAFVRPAIAPEAATGTPTSLTAPTSLTLRSPAIRRPAASVPG